MDMLRLFSFASFVPVEPVLSSFRADSEQVLSEAISIVTRYVRTSYVPPTACHEIGRGSKFPCLPLPPPLPSLFSILQNRGRNQPAS